MSSTQPVELLLPKLPPAARKAYRVPSISHNNCATQVAQSTFTSTEKRLNTKAKSLAESGEIKPFTYGEYHSLPRVPTESPHNITI